MRKPHKPSPYQAQLLADVARGERTLPPDGTPDAGRYASHWWRATEVLCKAGLLVRAGNLAFEEKVTGKGPAHERSAHLRNLGRRAVVIHRSGPHFLVRVLAAEVAS